jgi:hypothetical protein
MVDTHEPPPVSNRRMIARMGLWAAIGAATMMVLAALVVLTHLPHTPQLVPGQKPSVFAFLDLVQAA